LAQRRQQQIQGEQLRVAGGGREDLHGVIAGPITGARFIELEGRGHIPWIDPDQIVDEPQEFLTGARGDRRAERLLATILLTGIVSSTEHAASRGDRSWRLLLEATT
jgi:hypothetical protein